MAKLLRLKNKLLIFLVILLPSNVSANAWLIKENKKLLELNFNVDRHHLVEHTEFDPSFIKESFKTEIPKNRNGINDRNIYQNYFNLNYVYGLRDDVNLGFNLRFNSESYTKLIQF